MSNPEPAAVLDATEPTLLRVPFEGLKRAAKDRKAVLDEAQEAVAALKGQAASGADGVDRLIMRLQGLKRKLADVSSAESKGAGQCKARLEHLQKLGSPAGSMISWNRQRMDRVLVDHLQRSGYHEAAEQLSKAAGIEELVDSDIYEDAKRVVAALRQQNCGPALAWCADNKGKLKRLKSPLEFRLRVQEFVELVKQDRQQEAVSYARAHLAPWAALYLPELMRAMTTLAYPPTRPRCPPQYLRLYEPSRWEDLVTLFRKELYRLHGLPAESQLVIHLQAGLSALKTPASYQPSANREDPLSLPTFKHLAEGLPYAKHVHSKLLCSVTHALMTDANPPIVLPNGYVYSQAAVEAICAANGGRMVCPRTGSVYAADELRRAFIV